MTGTYRYPFTSTPDGWYHVAASDEVEVGQVRSLHFFGRDLVLFRTERGEAVVLDAHCPHLGAHLGHGGQVVGESIRCPFHAWRFASDGRCVEVPYLQRGRLPEVGLTRWPVHECVGLILVWHSDDGTKPDWRMPEIPEYAAEDWQGYLTRAWTIRMHVQELCENVPDRAHFEVIHGLPEPPGADAEVDGPLYRQLTTLPNADGSQWVVARQECWGLGLVWLRTDVEPRVTFLTATTPIDEETCLLKQFVLVRDPEGKSELGEATRASVEMVFAQTEFDVPIWENKVYREKPPLVEEDGPLPLLRRWARQFYPEYR